MRCRATWSAFCRWDPGDAASRLTASFGLSRQISSSRSRSHSSGSRFFARLGDRGPMLYADAMAESGCSARSRAVSAIPTLTIVPHCAPRGAITALLAASRRADAPVGAGTDAAQRDRRTARGRAFERGGCCSSQRDAQLFGALARIGPPTCSRARPKRSCPSVCASPPPGSARVRRRARSWRPDEVVRARRGARRVARRARGAARGAHPAR